MTDLFDSDLGIAVDSTAAERAEVARLAERLGFDLLTPAPGDADQWTAAAWLAGVTRRIRIGVVPALAADPDPSDPEAPYPAVLAKARESLEQLAGDRLVDDGWVLAPEDADLETLESLAAADLAVVVPAADVAAVERLAELAGRTGPRRSAAARARRVPGIDYDAVPASLAATAIEPGDPEHRSVSSTYLRGGAPGLVLRPSTPHEVADAVAFARAHRDVPLGIRSAGHGISGRSTNRGGIVIDVGGMDAIEVLDTDRRLVRIGPGATWKRVAHALAPYGWAIGSGDYGGVGVGGLATAGGIGFLSRSQGLTIDRLRAVELVLADGTLVRASRDEHPDLFWAVRGAGANFGIATAFEFEAEELGEVGWAQLTLVSDDLERSLLRYGELARRAPRDTTVFLVTGRPQAEGAVIQLFGVVADGDQATIVERLTPFLELGALARQQVVVTPYTGVMDLAADVGPEGQHGFGEPHARSGFVPELTPEFARDAVRMLERGAVHFFELRAMGGAIADVPADETAFSHRTPEFQLAAMGADDRALEEGWAPLRRHLDGLYLSFETSTDPARLADAFPPPVLARLRELKRRDDPDNLFRDNFNIDPTASDSEEAVA